MAQVGNTRDTNKALQDDEKNALEKVVEEEEEEDDDDLEFVVDTFDDEDDCIAFENEKNEAENACIRRM